MLAMLMILAVGASTPSVAAPSTDSPRVVQCTARNTSEGKDRKCHVKIPRGTTVRACDAKDKDAGRCALDERKVAWTAGENGARCVLSKKTDWTKRVAMKVSKKTKPGAGSCTLFVSLQ